MMRLAFSVKTADKHYTKKTPTGIIDVLVSSKFELFEFQ